MNLPTQKRERKISYFLIQKPTEFKSKKEIEAHLNKEGGLKEGWVLIKGKAVAAQKTQAFKLS